MLELLGLVDEATQVAGELAYGKQKQLEFAIALATNPKLLLLDEPDGRHVPGKNHGRGPSHPTDQASS